MVRSGATHIASAGEEGVDKSEREIVLDRPSCLDRPRPSTPIVEPATGIPEIRPRSSVPPPADRPADPNQEEDPETRVP